MEYENEKVGSKYCFIVNPTAGSGLCEKLFAVVASELHKLGVAHEVRFTEFAGHAARLADTACSEGYDTVVAVGGDGTVREVASALCGRAGVRFGILPFGTGNDFASALALPSDPLLALRIILNGKAQKSDLGSANGKVFTNVCGLGFDVDVLRRVEKRKKGRTGMLPYIAGIIDAILHRRRLKARISIDGGEERAMDALIITACNGRRFGGGMLVAPNAVQDDGFFDICISEWVSFFRLITLLPLFIKGKHIGKKPITYLRARSLRVWVEEENTVQLDGELIEKTPLECRIIPGAIDIIRPQCEQPEGARK